MSDRETLDGIGADIRAIESAGFERAGACESGPQFWALPDFDDAPHEIRIGHDGGRWSADVYDADGNRIAAVMAADGSAAGLIAALDALGLIRTVLPAVPPALAAAGFAAGPVTWDGGRDFVRAGPRGFVIVNHARGAWYANVYESRETYRTGCGDVSAPATDADPAALVDALRAAGYIG